MFKEYFMPVPPKVVSAQRRVSAMKCARLLLVCAVLLPLSSLRADESVERLTTKAGVRFGLWPQRPKKPAPTMFVLASTVDATLKSAYFRQAGEMLAKEGWLLVSIDLPCHGEQVRPGEGSGLAAWRVRVERDENVVEEATGRLSQVLDYLLAEGISDPERIAALGTSRGGFIAFHFAAADKRVKCAAAFAPLTDLTKLSEFRGAEDNPLAQSLALDRRAEALAGRPLWVVIGDRDLRVSTDAVIQFTRRVTAASLQKELSAQVDLHVIAEPKGHTVPAGYAEVGAAWFRRQFPTP